MYDLKYKIHKTVLIMLETAGQNVLTVYS